MCVWWYPVTRAKYAIFQSKPTKDARTPCSICTRLAALDSSLFLSQIGPARRNKEKYIAERRKSVLFFKCGFCRNFLSASSSPPETELEFVCMDSFRHTEKKLQETSRNNYSHFFRFLFASWIYSYLASLVKNVPQLTVEKFVTVRVVVSFSKSCKSRDFEFPFQFLRLPSHLSVF